MNSGGQHYQAFCFSNLRGSLPLSYSLSNFATNTRLLAGCFIFSLFWSIEEVRVEGVRATLSSALQAFWWGLLMRHSLMRRDLLRVGLTDGSRLCGRNLGGGSGPWCWHVLCIGVDIHRSGDTFAQWPGEQ